MADVTTHEAHSDSLGGSRRDFLKTCALLGGSSLLACLGGCTNRSDKRSAAPFYGEGVPYDLGRPENVLYSTCLQCNTGCEIKVKLLDGVVAKIDGSPYAPRTMYPTIPYATPLEDAARADGVLCPKGHSGLQTLYDPYRLVRVLKRAGPRGCGRWKTIPFEQAVAEIVEGGRLFAEVPGEEARHVDGLRAVWALRDAAVMKAMAADVASVRAGRMTVAEFKERHRDHLGALIDPDHPDLGPRNNQFVFTWGRLKAGRSEFFKRFVVESFGSVNAHGHTTVCQGSLYFAAKAIMDQYVDGDWKGGKKAYWMADADEAEFILYIGANPMEGGYGPPLKSQRISTRLERGELRIAFVDPRLPKGSARAWKWVPIKPGTEAALALAMIRWIIDHDRFDRRYLENASLAAARADGEPTFTNATWLVRIDADGEPGPFLRASEIGLAGQEPRTGADGKSWTFDPFVVFRDGQPVAIDPYADDALVEGDLFVDTAISGVRVKSALQILRDSASTHDLAGWAEICGVRERDIVELAREFTAHGKRAAVEPHRGCSQHTNGFYAVLAVYALNMLIGNLDWRGGLMKGGGTYDQAGEKGHAPFNFKKNNPGKLAPFGYSLIRHEADYEQSTIFAGFPARRPWFPFSSDVYQEIIPSAGSGYPYPIKILFLYMGTPVYALPAGNRNIEVLTDVEKIPLFVASDIVVGETSMYADYIFPDLTYLERWEFHGTHPSVPQKVSPVRQPVVAPLVETVEVFGQRIPCSMEAVFLACAERMGLPGFGPDGFGPGAPLERPEDFYLKMVANVAAGEKPGDEVPDASSHELELFAKSRRHLPASVYDPDRWKTAVGAQWWPKVVYVLNRGGRFQDFDAAWEGGKLRSRQGGLLNLYLEKVASKTNSMTGRRYLGYPVHRDVEDSLGRPVDDGPGFPLHLITYREIAATKSRTIGNGWLLAVLPENRVLMNAADTRRLGLRDGALVRIESASNPEGIWDLGDGRRVPMVGRVRSIQGIRPGVVAFALGFGHWAYGSADIVIDGQLIRRDQRRSAGVHANAAMGVDPHLGDVCLQDLVGGSAVFYDTKVRVRAV
ncbi:MAG: molybdopterin oxidoreductase [Planctomycetota bacterium]|nr:MAG: molybdopterin oxidoreductase [Planctomycetota bacterium]